MKKFCFVCYTVVATVLMIGVAYGVDATNSYKSLRPFYVEFDTGYVIPTMKFKHDNFVGIEKHSGGGVPLVLSIGYRFANHQFSTELAWDGYLGVLGLVDHPEADINVSIRGYGVFLNGYYNFNPDSAVSPYIKAGIGYKKHRYQNMTIDGIAGAIGLGVKLNITEFMFIDAAYTLYISPNIANVQKDISCTPNMHSLTVGIGFRF